MTNEIKCTMKSCYIIEYKIVALMYLFTYSEVAILGWKRELCASNSSSQKAREIRTPFPVLVGLLATNFSRLNTFVQH